MAGQTDKTTDDVDVTQVLFEGSGYFLGAMLGDAGADDRRNVREILQSAFDFWLDNEPRTKKLLELPVRDFLLRLEATGNGRFGPCVPWASVFAAIDEGDDAADQPG